MDMTVNGMDQGLADQAGGSLAQNRSSYGEQSPRDNHSDETVPLGRKNELFICLWPNCQVATTQLYALERHYNLKHKVNRTIFPCPFLDCNFHTKNTFDRKDKLVRHIAREHPTRKGWMVIDRSLDQDLATNCYNCGNSKLYSSLDSAKAHLHAHLPFNLSERKFCGESEKVVGLTVPLDLEDWIAETDVDTIVLEGEDLLKREIQDHTSKSPPTAEIAGHLLRTGGGHYSQTVPSVSIDPSCEIPSDQKATVFQELTLNNTKSIKQESDAPCTVKTEKPFYRGRLEESKEIVGLPRHVSKIEWQLGAAEQLSMNIFTVTSKRLGPDHPQTLMVLAHFSILLQSQGRYSEAERLNFNVTSAMEAVLGPKHAATLILKINLTVLYRQQGRWADAELLESQLTKLVWEMQSPKLLSSILAQHRCGREPQLQKGTVSPRAKTSQDELKPCPVRGFSPLPDRFSGQKRTRASDDGHPRKRQCLLTPEDSPNLRCVDSVPDQGRAVTTLSDFETERGKFAFLPLPVGHPKLKRWAEILPSVRSQTKDILGKGNRGSIDFGSFQGEPSLFITCKKPGKVDVTLLNTKTVEWGFPAIIAKGSARRSWGPDEDPRDSWSIPAVSARYTRRVDCGSSLGTISGPFENDKVSLGGYLKLKHQNQSHWTLYAETVHHAVEPSENEGGTDDSETDEDESVYSSTSAGWTSGIVNGKLEGFEGDINFRSPARPDIVHAGNERDRLAQLCNLLPALDRIFKSRNLAEQRSMPEKDTEFGKACWSSGLCEDNGSQMDWLLIGELPTHRVGCNSISEHPTFSHVNKPTPTGLGAGASESLPTDYVDEIAFQGLMNAILEDAGIASQENPYWFRVQGHGSESGLKDGFLNTAPSIEFDGENTFIRYSFHPRDRPGLGRSGDSGTWIFLHNGILLGQIHSYDRVKDLAYFTPMYKIFSHIKKVTRATDVKLPEEADYMYFGSDSNDYGYCTPGDAVESPTASRLGLKDAGMSFNTASTPLGQAMSPRVAELKHWSP